MSSQPDGEAQTKSDRNQPHLMAASNPMTQRFYESIAIECVTVNVAELYKAAGAIGCLSGIVERELI